MLLTRVAAVVVALVACLTAGTPAALADGDPASDYLITQPAFLPFDAKIDKANSRELTALLAASKKAGFEVRVAVIATRRDLGAVPVLYRKPVEYARFLGQELHYWYKGELLVVMPNGYGVSRDGPAPAADRARVAALAPAGTTDGNALVTSAGTAVKALAARRGIDLSQVKAGGSGSMTTRDRIAIGLGAVVVLALAGGVVFVRRKRGARG